MVDVLGRFGPGEIRVLARRTQTATQSPAPVRFLAGDISDPDAIAQAIDGCDVVFHLAALKDGAVCEADPDRALRTNVLGSANVLLAARREERVRRLIAISSDKASAPTSVLGMTKALMERLVTQVAAATGRSFGSVRLGNVLGASDSVLMRWHASARSGWIEVTDPKMTRFALTREEAVSHIVALCSRSLEGEVVVPLMRAYQLGELATAFAEEHRVAVRITGARPWEKAHATLLSEDEALIARRDGDLVVIDPRKPGGGLGVITSAGADRLSEKELANFVRMA